MVGRRIEHCVSEQTIDDVDVAVLSGPHKGFVETSVDRQHAGFEHALHNRQSTMGSLITEFKFDFARHLRSSTARHAHVLQCV
jgi:hypothetical protein